MNQNNTPLIRTECKIFSRVNGWLTDVNSWNKGKTAEWDDRVTYKINE